MSTETAAPPQLLNVQIDGVWLQFPKGTRVIEACAKAGKFVPRYGCSLRSNCLQRR